MQQRRRGLHPRLGLLASVVLIVGACGTAASPSPSASSPAASEPPAASAPAASEAPFENALVYPESGEAPCGTAPYTGNFKKISATGAHEVVFELCNPDVAFLSKIAFTSFAINDTAYLEAHVPDKSIVDAPNGTGPYKMTAWNRGVEIDFEQNPDYWGEFSGASKLVFRWSTEGLARVNELNAGTVDGIDNVPPESFEGIRGNSALQLKEREGLNTLYLGFNNNPQVDGFDNANNPMAKEAVRQAIAQGIDRQQLVDQFYPPGSEVAQFFTPCAIPNGCSGDEWYAFDAAAAKQALADAGYPNGFETTLSYRPAVRGYLPDPPAVATAIQAQLKANLGITVTLDQQDDTTYLDNANQGKLTGIYLLGWGADYPDVTNFLDFHFGAGASPQFGDKFDDITSALAEGAAGSSDADREPSYVAANNAIRTHVPMVPLVHGGSGVAYKADVENAHSSPLGNEAMAVMNPGGRDTFVWMQNGEPGGLYCADETDGESLRACQQTLESLYQYEIGGTAAEPALAEECAPNDTLDVWTCTLRSGVKFHDGSDFDANDVVLSFAVQWDAEHELHVGRESTFTYFSSLFGGFLNPPPAE
jgi:peptide/nickel transport system substrate-binding protein